MNKITKILIASVLLFFSVVYMFIAITGEKNDILIAEDTPELTATIRDVVFSADGENIERIYTNEHSYYLVLFKDKNVKLNKDDFKFLKKGTTIYYKSNNFEDYENYEASPFYPMFSLRTEDVVFSTVEQYNSYLRKALFVLKEFATIVSFVFLSIAIKMLVNLKQPKFKYLYALIFD